MPEKFPLPTIEQMGLEVPQEKKKKGVPEKIPANVEKPKQEVVKKEQQLDFSVAKKRQKELKEKKREEHKKIFAEMLERKEELPEDIRAIVEKISDKQKVSLKEYGKFENFRGQWRKEKKENAEKPQQEAAPEKKKKKRKVDTRSEYFVALRRHIDELPEDIRIILDKVDGGHRIPENEKSRLRRIGKMFKKSEADLKALEAIENKTERKQKYNVPSPKELFEKSGYAIPTPDGLKKKMKYKIEKEKLFRGYVSTQEHLRIIDEQIKKLKREQETLKKHAEESRRIGGEYAPGIYGQSEELIKEILKLEIERDKKRKSLEKEKVLPSDFFRVLKTRNKVGIKLLKEKMIRENPGNIERIEAIFWLFALITKTKKKYAPDEFEKIKKDIFSTTEKEFLLTQFVYANSGNRELLADFWNIGEEIALTTAGTTSIFEGCRKGILGQAAAWHLLKKIGKKPQLSLPEEDRDYSIDLWGDKNMAIQVKSAQMTSLRRIDKIAFPALFYEDRGVEKVINTPRQTQERFLLDIEEYKKVKGHDIEGYWLEIGRSERDDITGMPTEEMVERIKKEFEKIEKK
jgi:hypothetical protein